MRKLLMVVGMLMVACATVGYNESGSCPMVMDEEQHASGLVRCRALCSSYGRNTVDYGRDCKCYCAPAGKSSAPKTPSKPPVYQNQM